MLQDGHGLAFTYVNHAQT